MFDDALECVFSLGREWRVCLSEDVAQRILGFMNMLLKWNARLNLTGAKDLSQLCGEHLPDSFALSRLCPESADVVDVGAGGGLPSFPFSIIRADCRITLVEPRAKRVAFLHTATREWGSECVSVQRARAEELVRPCFSVAASRATFRPEVWLGIACRLLARGGRAIVFSTTRPEIVLPSARLVDAVEYRTAVGAPRWSGSYCFT